MSDYRLLCVPVVRHLVVRFENYSRKYEMRVKFDGFWTLGRLEIEALAECMKIAVRGNIINDKSFRERCEYLKTRFACTDGPQQQDGRVAFEIVPGREPEKAQKGDFIKHIFFLFSSVCGGLHLMAQTFVEEAYNINFVLPTLNQYFFAQDCNAFIDVLFFFEPGKEMDLTQYISNMSRLRKKYNFVELSYIFGKDVYADITPTSVSYPNPVRAGGLAAVPGLPRCPYPDILYTCSLQQSDQAQVYAGVTREGQKVAVKVFSGEANIATETYRTELRVLLKMSKHPNVIEVLQLFETPQPALVMRLIQGAGDLRNFIRRGGAMSLEKVRRIGLELGEGIAHLHRNGIVHCDLNAANVLLQKTSSGNLSPVIIDLGLGKLQAKRMSPGGEKHSMDDCTATLSHSSIYEKTTRVKGTERWMASEMITDKAWSKMTDVFAFDIILWELLSGKRPYDDIQTTLDDSDAPPCDMVALFEAISQTSSGHITLDEFVEFFTGEGWQEFMENPRACELLKRAIRKRRRIE